MTAIELIALLSGLPDETKIYIWFDGERLEPVTVDYMDSDYVDINAEEL